MTGGIALALAAAIANAFAVALQARENRRAPLSEAGHVRLFVGLARRPAWLAGTGLMILVWPLQVAALALAPITVVQPLLATTQLVLLAVARMTLRERVGVAETAGAVAIVGGIAAVVWASPRHSTPEIGLGKVLAPLLAVGLMAVGAYLSGRLRPRRPLTLVLGAGLAYAWVDFANKLLASNLAGHRWPVAGAWLIASLGFGGLAFLEETTALQRRPAVTVTPVIGAVQSPLPVLMALWAGVETWDGAPHRVGVLLAGVAVISAGAAALGRSSAVARLAGEDAARSPRRPAVCPAGAQ